MVNIMKLNFNDKIKLRGDLMHLLRVKKPLAKVWGLVRHVLLIGISFVILYPLLYMVSNAFKPVAQYYDPSVIWLPKSLTLENFKTVLLVIDLPAVMKNTFLISLLPALIETFTCMLVAYGLAVFKFRGRGIVFALVILTIIVPQQTLATSLYASYRNMDFFGLLGLLSNLTGGAINRPNLIGTMWVTVLPAIFAVGFKCGLYIFIYMQFFIGLPKELQEAAAIDGCSAYGTFIRIVLPTTRNITLTTILLSFVWNWNDYFTPAMFVRTKDTISTAMAGFKSALENLHNLGTGATNIQTANTQIQAACLISIIPLVILYVILQKYFAESIENTGLTGL
jgi:multiple sugar transport system permease protein